MPSEARLEIFWKNIKKDPKIHCLALKLYTGPPNCITGASKSGGQGGPGPPGPPPGSASEFAAAVPQPRFSFERKVFRASHLSHSGL